MHRTVIIIAALLLIGLTHAAAAASSTSADNRKTEGSKGITVDDLGRGLKSAAQNIEKEIPKMGSAIGNAVKRSQRRDRINRHPKNRRSRINRVASIRL